MLSSLKQVWQGLSLARQFALASSAVLFLGMAIIGAWVARKIEDGVTRNTASEVALYMDSIVSPLVQDLATEDRLPADNQRALETLLQHTAIGRHVTSVKIWKRGGLIAYASHNDLIGRRFEPTPKLVQAWHGTVTAEYDHLDHEENSRERASGMPLLEVYVPVRHLATDKVIAVAEFYADAGKLKRELFRAKRESWLLVGLVTLSTIAALYVIVRRGSRVIEEQRTSLGERIQELSSLLAQNEELRDRVQRASNSAALSNERFLRRLGSELHDGPAQLLGLALLRLDSVARVLPEGAARGQDDVEMIRNALSDAMKEIRHLSTGLAMPELEGHSLAEALRIAARSHKVRTGTEVTTEIDNLPDLVTQAVKTSLYRFVQEGLNNAFRHAGGRGQRLLARRIRNDIIIEVRDEGPGMAGQPTPAGGGLGLTGLRERIEALGGSMEFISRPGHGTRLSARLPIAEEWCHG